jgi:hypothetical protein
LHVLVVVLKETSRRLGVLHGGLQSEHASVVLSASVEGVARKQLQLSIFSEKSGLNQYSQKRRLQT